MERRQRLTRPQQVERNRELVLDAAATVFEEQGYMASRVEEIAERAGFSRGVVYSQFADKADLFLTLLERRRDRRSQDHRELLGRLEGADSVEDFARFVLRATRSSRTWNLLNVEFRVAVARDAELSARYRRLHVTTVADMAEALGRLYELADVEPPGSLDDLATLALAVGYGLELERVALGSGPSEDAELAAFVRVLGLRLVPSFGGGGA